MLRQQSPVSRTHSSVNRGPIVVTILGLLFSRRPTTVFWRVSKIVVDALQRITHRFTLAHVGQEVLEIQPPFTHGDSSASVSGVVGGSRIGASRLHRLPGQIFRAFSPQPPAGVPMALTSTSATLSAFTKFQIRSICTDDGAAITLAQPHSLYAPMRSDIENCEAPKLLTNQINFCARHYSPLQPNYSIDWRIAL